MPYKDYVDEVFKYLTTSNESANKTPPSTIEDLVKESTSAPPIPGRRTEFSRSTERRDRETNSVPGRTVFELSRRRVVDDTEDN